MNYRSQGMIEVVLPQYVLDGLILYSILSQYFLTNSPSFHLTE